MSHVMADRITKQYTSGPDSLMYLHGTTRSRTTSPMATVPHAEVPWKMIHLPLRLNASKSPYDLVKGFSHWALDRMLKQWYALERLCLPLQ